MSPRQYALTISTNDEWKWSSINSGGSDAGEGDDSRRRDGGHRRLGTSGAAHNAASKQAPPCIDRDEQLQKEEGDPSLTCANYAHACEIDLGIELCPYTCGYCAPWHYNQTKRFDKPQVTMLPVVLYQTRFAMAECHGFAETYSDQPTNPALWMLPPLDGERFGALLTCVDRSTPLQDDYALSVDCPAGMDGDLHCKNGVEKFTAKSSFHGMTVFPKMLIEPKHDLEVLEAVQWLDAQTDTVTLSTMIYTEDIEVFTSLSVDFTIDIAGNVNPTYTMVSYRDMLKESKSKFIICLIICSACNVLGLITKAWELYSNRKECRCGLVMYEFISRLSLVAYPVALLISWSQQIPMSEEYDLLLHTYLDVESSSKEEMRVALQKYFDVKTHIYEETTWLKGMKIGAYVVLYIQFLQLILYMSAHPKLGVLTETIRKALVHLLHFFFLFGAIFASLAFVAFWMLGEQLRPFQSFGNSMETQARMMFGEFIYADGAHHLSDSFTAMYWVYACSFMLIVFFLLLNFFLAIIVDAFIKVKGMQENESTPMVLHDLFYDLLIVARLNLRWRMRRWPPRGEFLELLRKAIKEQTEMHWAKQLKSEEVEEGETTKH